MLGFSDAETIDSLLDNLFSFGETVGLTYESEMN